MIRQEIDKISHIETTNDHLQAPNPYSAGDFRERGDLRQGYTFWITHEEDIYGKTANIIINPTKEHF